MLRRTFLFTAAAGLMTGCQTTTQPAATLSTTPPKLVPASSDKLTVSGMKIVAVEVVLNPGMGRPFRYAGLPPAKVHETLARKVQAALNGANPSGIRPAKAVVKLSAVTIADATPNQKAYDSAILASARFYDQETGAKIGEGGALGAQATYRPSFLAGQDRVLSPEQELELITTHGATVLAKRIFG
jgi:hypothetical protein